MAWLTTYGAGNKVDITTRLDRADFTAVSAGITSSYRDITIDQYNYVGMTEAAADTCQAAVNDPSNGVTATKKREGPGGNFLVAVTETTYGAWTSS